ncbi:MAG: hypothetical protein NZ529_09930, partial [Cytophagaceae bacterium]|nr:hypothetical protein [Cytophagaceae bacterium]MDW8457102.1 hypothetical protein [Cytophagaceae bacterium]
MIRKTLLFPIYFCLVLISCDTKTKEAHTEESTERRDIFYNNQNTEKLADSLGEMPRITIDKTTGIFNIAGKVVELKQTDESKFNEICTPELKYDQSPVCEGINDLEKCRMLFES